MTGTPWITVTGSRPYYHLSRADVYIEDREGMLYDAVAVHHEDCYGANFSLSYYSLADLGLPHGSTTPEIFDAAIEGGAKVVPCGIALRTLIEYPGAFKNNFLRRFLGKVPPFQSCLLGIKPIISERGRKYVVELAEKHFRFRLAGEDERWPDYEYWVFAD